MRINTRELICLLAGLLCGCDGPVETITIEMVGSSLYERTYLAPDQANVGGGQALLRSADDDVMFSVDYALEPDRRLYVFDGDIEEGITLGRGLLLPQGLGASTSRREEVFSFVDPQLAKVHRSFRAYDVGMCGGFSAWPALTEELAAAFDEVLLENPSFTEASRTEPIVFTPVHRVGGTAVPRLEDADTLRILARYRGTPSGCSSVALSIAVEVAIVRVPGTIRRAPRRINPDAEYSPSCREPTTGSTRQIDDGNHYDFMVEVRDVSIFARGCVLGSLVEDAFETALVSAVRDLLHQKIQEQLRIPLFITPSALRRFCTCDEECNPGSVAGPWIVPGQRHLCEIRNLGDPLNLSGQCVVQLEADRVFIRPEGLTVVIAEDTNDFQNAAFDIAFSGGPLRPTLCIPGATGPVVAADDGLETVSMVPFYVF